jgi:hypothetical protein
MRAVVVIAFLSSKVMWVAIDCRSKNWVAVLKGLGSSALFHIVSVLIAPLNKQLKEFYHRTLHTLSYSQYR